MTPPARRISPYLLTTTAAQIRGIFKNRRSYCLLNHGQKPLTIQRSCKTIVIPVERQPVKSRILRSVGYDDSVKILEIEFQNGQIYRFSDVPPKVHGDLMHSDEIGKYFSEKVRPKFQSKQVAGK